MANSKPENFNGIDAARALYAPHVPAEEPEKKAVLDAHQQFEALQGQIAEVLRVVNSIADQLRELLDKNESKKTALWGDRR